MSCNTLPRWEFLPFEPTYHGVSDVPNREHLRGLIAPQFKKMLRFNVTWPGYDNVDGFHLVEKAPGSVQIHSDGLVGFDNDLPPLPTGRTTPITLLQLGVWFGYREFYFVGLDLSRGYVDKPAALVSNAGVPFIIDANSRIMASVQRSMERARDDIEAHGGAIYDCTPGGFMNRTSHYGTTTTSVAQRTILEYRSLEEVLA